MAPAAEFYDAVMSALDYPSVNRSSTSLGYGIRNDSTDDSHTYISIIATGREIVPDRRHWCFRAADRERVDAFYAAGLAHGGTDDGPPGVREHYHVHYYAAFLIDPDGNRIEAVTHRET